MTLEELSKLHLNEEVYMWEFNQKFEIELKIGYVTKIYNGNYQIQVWFDHERTPRVVGYKKINLTNKKK
jgi:hypothetical protein